MQEQNATAQTKRQPQVYNFDLGKTTPKWSREGDSSGIVDHIGAKSIQRKG